MDPGVLLESPKPPNFHPNLGQRTFSEKADFQINGNNQYGLGSWQPDLVSPDT